MFLPKAVRLAKLLDILSEMLKPQIAIDTISCVFLPSIKCDAPK